MALRGCPRALTPAADADLAPLLCFTAAWTSIQPLFHTLPAREKPRLALPARLCLAVTGGLLGACLLRDPGHPPVAAAAEHLPARGGRRRPSQNRLPSGTQLPKDPGEVEFSKSASGGATCGVSTARSGPRMQTFPGKRRRGAGAGTARLPGGLGGKLQHKRPMPGRAAAAEPGSSPSPGRSEPASAQPAARSGRPPQSPPGPGMRGAAGGAPRRTEARRGSAPARGRAGGPTEGCAGGAAADCPADFFQESLSHDNLLLR